MELSTEILSNITVFNKYSKYLPHKGRRETWEDIVARNMGMHLDKYPNVTEEIINAYQYVFRKEVLPSMRSLQFGGRPIELANNRIYNCAFLPIEHIDAFPETMFLLLGGTGVGFSVQQRHVNQLPKVLGPQEETRRFLVGDSIEGWADAIKVLIESHFLGKQRPVFDLRDIRPKGAALITTGGKAPGPVPLRACLTALDTMLCNHQGEQLKPLVVHDMICVIANAVLAGGIRRAALISLFDHTDEDMLTCKSGEWWVDNPQRGRANNSAILLRGTVNQDAFNVLMARCQSSGAGEPGVYWTNNLDWGTNPCCEIALRPYQFCNLNEINASTVQDQDDFNARAKAAAFIGTLQAGYVDFHYLRPIWKQTTKTEALIGIGITGIGSNKLKDLNQSEAANIVITENIRVAKLLGINQAARTTTVKPSGTSSLVVGSSSGVHGWHNDYYMRRMRMGKDEALYNYLLKNIPELVEDDQMVPNGAIAIFPQKAPEGAILRHESMLELLARIQLFNTNWVKAGHVTGDNTHNVSCTVSVQNHEWPVLIDWMWNHRNDYNGISVLPYDGGTYPQMPFEDCTKEEYESMLQYLTAVDLTQVKEEGDNTDLAGEIACGGGACELIM